MQVVVDSLMVHYQRAGAGKQLVLLHGWGDNISSWQSFIKALANDYEVIALDLPGFGGSEAPKNAWGLADYARFVADFLLKIRVSPYAIIGHSNGGAIAIRAVGEKLLKAQKLVLIDSAGIRGQYNARNRSLRLIAKTGKVLTTPLPSRLKKRLRRKVYDTIGSDMLVAEHMQATFKRIVTDDVRPFASKLSLPAILIYGEHDAATPVQYARMFHDLIRDSRLEIIPAAGHFPHLDDPNAVLTLIKGFLK